MDKKMTDPKILIQNQDMQKQIVDLEIKSAHYEHQIEELSQVMYAQQKSIDKLELLLQALTQRLADAMGDGEGGEIRSSEKPPHY